LRVSLCLLLIESDGRGVIVECVAVVVDDIGRDGIRMAGFRLGWVAVEGIRAWPVWAGSLAMLVERA
jgi:hypothetical protein